MEFAILHEIQQLRGPWMDGLMKGVSFLGNGGWLWIALTAVLLLRKDTRRIGGAAAASLVLCFLVGNVFLKNWVARPRPCWLDPSVNLLISVPRDYSFPSGHTMIGMTAAMSVFLYNRFWGGWLLALASLIGFSRLYLFVHFPTDVLAGAAAGILIAVWMHREIERISLRQRKDGDNGPAGAGYL